MDVIPCAERVHLCKTGSDATAAAVRLARIHTGRDKIVRWGYNGWHDWCSAKTAGIPEGVKNLAHCSFWTRCVPASACRLVARRNTMA